MKIDIGLFEFKIGLIKYYLNNKKKLNCLNYSTLLNKKMVHTGHKKIMDIAIL